MNKKEREIESCAKKIEQIYIEKINRQIPNAIALGAIGVWDIMCAYMDDIDNPNNNELEHKKAVDTLLEKLRKEKLTLIDRRKKLK